MERVRVEEDKIDVSKEEESMQLSKTPTTGGLRTMPFIMVNEAFERMASYGLMPNMILYLINVFHMPTVTASTVLTLWSSLSDALAILGAFLSDSYLGRFGVIIIGSICSFIGMILLLLTAVVPQLKPPACSLPNNACDPATGAQLAVLLFSFGFMSIGAGCIRPCSIAFGADQLSKKENSDNSRVLDSYFNWYYGLISVSTIVAFTLIVYTQDNLGWGVGFSIPAILMFISALMFVVGSPFYVKVKPSKSLFAGYVQAIVAACKKRNLSLPHSNFDQYYHENDSTLLTPSDNLRCLNKACLIKDPKIELNPDGSVANHWTLCSVQQVEYLKSLIRVLPFWSTGVLQLLSLNQGSFNTLQINTMDRHVTKSFQIPAGSFQVFLVLSVAIWVASYDRIMVPLLAKYAGMPHGLSPKVRMGTGILISCAAMAYAAVAETIRRNIAIEDGLEDQPKAIVNMSAAWLIPTYVLLGFSEGFSAVGQIEYYYSQFSKTMSSLAMALFTFGMAMGSLLNSALINIVDKITSQGGQQSWLSSNLNKAHLNYYYGLLCVIGLANFVYFLICCRACGSTEHERPGAADEEDEQFEYRQLATS